MNTLVLIPARGGSKSVPRKNIRLFNGKPLIQYSIEIARQFTSDENICLSSDDDEIIAFARTQLELFVPFKRPEEFAQDTSGMREVLLHALDYYKDQGIVYDNVLLLQPTSPLRQIHHLKEAASLYNHDIDMVMSVCETSSNPYFILYEETSEGFLEKSKKSTFVRRQDVPKVYEVNGAIYIMNALALRKYDSFNDYPRIVKYVMPEELSIDIDTPFDWKLAEFISKEKKMD